MKLKEILDQLSAGEFSQMSIGGTAAGVIDNSNCDRVMTHIGLGLTALFTRFNLKERELTFPIVSTTDTYQFAFEDLIKIEKVKTTAGLEFPLNVAGAMYNCSTPSMNTLRIPKIIQTQSLELPDELKVSSLVVVYRADHPKIVSAGNLALLQAVDLELPSTHVLPLLYFVASRVNNPVGMTNEFNAGNNYAMKYEQVCQELEGKGIQVDVWEGNYRAIRNGWV